MAILKHYYEAKKRVHGYTKTLLCNNEEGSWLYLNIIMKHKRGLMAILKHYYETMTRAHGYTKTLL